MIMIRNASSSALMRLVAYFFLGMLMTMTGAVTESKAAMNEYCSTPPFLNNSNVSPNIMIMLDNSGSMNDHPFTTAYDPTQFNSGYYFGYFDPTKMYQYDSTNNLWKIYTGTDPGSTNGDPTKPIASGNLLNWAATRKLEVAKKLLVGGNPGFLCSGSQCSSSTCVSSGSSCVANPRTVTVGNTVKLYSEDAGSSNNVTFDNSSANPIVTAATYTNYLVPGYSDVIYPFSGNYTYKLGSGGCSSGPACSKLTISPASGSASSRFSSAPYTSDILPSPNYWAKSPTPFTTHSWTCTDNSSYRCTVRDNIGEDPTQTNSNVPDGDNSYIQNQRDTNPIMFGLNMGRLSGSGTINDVNVVVVARMAESPSGACVASSKHGKNTYTTRKIQGVLTVGGSNWPAAYTSLNNSSSNWNSYDAYTFTYSINPKTNLAWTWSDITGGALTAFGVQNNDNTVYTGTSNQGCFARITQVYIYIDATPPSGTYSLVVDTGQTSISGIIDQFTQGSSQARFGLSQYANSSNGGRVLVPVDFNDSTNTQTNTIANYIVKYAATTNTPLGKTEYELLSYFTQTTPRFSNSPTDYTVVSNSTPTSGNWDPFYYRYDKFGSGLSDRFVQCAKSYIIMMTDGEPTSDTGFPAGTPVTDTNGDGDLLDELALYGRTTDLRSGSCTGSQPWAFPCIPGTQNVYTYTVFLFGTGSQLLQTTAINGGFNGTPVAGMGTQPALVPPCQNKASGHPTQDELKDCYLPNMPDGTVNLTPPAGTDPPVPIGYYEGSDAYSLQAAITQTISDILKRAASGTAVSVLTTSSRGVGSMLQAYFLPSRQDGTREVTWTGYTQNLWLDEYDNLREDTVNDKQLVYDQDNVLKIFYDSVNSKTMAAMFTTDANGYGDPDVAGSLGSCIPNYTKEFQSVNYLWEAGLSLALKSASARNIITSNTVVKDAATAYSFSNNAFTTANVDATPAMSSALTPTGTPNLTADQVVQYTRGECLETGSLPGTPCGNTPNGTFRDRRVTQVSPGVPIPGGDLNGNVWKLGDIITSTPKVFANAQLNAYDQVFGDSTYTDYIKSDGYVHHSAIAFVGANDGMLHAFRVGYLKGQDDSTGSLGTNVRALFKNSYTSSDSSNNLLGDEVWAYIPFNAFPYLKYLADPGYCHMYFNDLPVTLVDVSINGAATATKTSASWKTVLIGGMRYGGACGNGIQPVNPPGGSTATVGFSSFFAIDITDPENPVPMWEFSDTDMGFATSYPALVRTGDNKNNGNYYLAFGSGSTRQPKSGQDLGRTTPGYIYVVDLRTGQRVQKIQLDHNAIVGDVISVDANLDNKSEKIYFGTSYQVGTAWKGKLESISIPDQDLSSGWTPTVRNLFSDNYPITAAPAVTMDAKGVIWVYAGSGKYESDGDQVDSTQQVFFGIRDLPGSGVTPTFSYPLSLTSLDNKTSQVTSGVVSGVSTACMYNSTLQSWQTTTMVTSINTSTVTAPSAVGWYVNLGTSPNAERVISKPLAIGGLVDFLTFVPTGDVCSGGGTSYLCSVAFDTGVAPAIVSIVSPDVTGGVTSGSVTVQRCVALGAGAPPKNEAIIIPPILSKTPPPTPPGKKKVTSGGSNPEEVPKMIQVSTGAIVKISNNPLFSVTSKIVQWLKK
jgi:type IV pilus assembly protein PilY1